MTGRELIEEIKQFDLDNDIRICFTEDGKVLLPHMLTEIVKVQEGVRQTAIVAKIG